MNVGARRIPDPLLECYLVGSLDAEARAEVEAVLARSEADQTRLAQLRAESEAFLVQHPPRPLVERFEALQQFPELAARRIPEPLLECYLMGSLDAEARAEVEAVLAQSEADQTRLAQLRVESEAFLVQHPPEPLIERFAEAQRVESNLKENNPSERSRLISLPDSARRKETLKPRLIPSKPQKEFGRQAVAYEQSGKSEGLAQSVTDLYRRLAPVVYGKARALLNNNEEAMDVTQEAFIVFMNNFDRAKSESEAFALLYRIASNLAIARLRERARKRERLLQGPMADENQNEASEGEMRRVESAMDLALLIRNESPQALSVAMLHFVEGLTVMEVGDVLNLSRRTVTRLLERFLKRARKHSKSFGGQEE